MSTSMAPPNSLPVTAAHRAHLEHLRREFRRTEREVAKGAGFLDSGKFGIAAEAFLRVVEKTPGVELPTELLLEPGIGLEFAIARMMLNRLQPEHPNHAQRAEVARDLARLLSLDAKGKGEEARRILTGPALR